MPQMPLSFFVLTGHKDEVVGVLSAKLTANEYLNWGWFWSKFASSISHINKIHHSCYPSQSILKVHISYLNVHTTVLSTVLC